MLAVVEHFAFVKTGVRLFSSFDLMLQLQSATLSVCRYLAEYNLKLDIAIVAGGKASRGVEFKNITFQDSPHHSWSRSLHMTDMFAAFDLKQEGSHYERILQVSMLSVTPCWADAAGIGKHWDHHCITNIGSFCKLPFCCKLMHSRL